MAKVDLDDLEKRLDCDMHCNQDVYDLIAELKVARECVEFLRKLSGQLKGSCALDGIPYRELDCLANYDEATK